MENVPTRVRRDTLRALSQVDILRAFPPEDVLPLAAAAEEVRFKKGERIVVEGAEGDAVFFLLSGRARVEHGADETVAEIGPGTVVGEISALKAVPRTASVTALTDATALRVGRPAFEEALSLAPGIRDVMERLAERRDGAPGSGAPDRQAWLGAALRTMEARARGIQGWLWAMIAGLALWAGIAGAEHAGWEALHHHPFVVAGVQLLTGLLIIQGACEAFVVGVERLGARLRWDGFISGTVGSMVSTLPEFVVIAFLVQVDPLAAFVTAVVTIFNNALIFSVYSFFLPKDKRGVFAMPRSLTIAGGELLIAGGAIALIVGSLMLILRLEEVRSSLAGLDLLVIGAVLLGIYAVYTRALIRYYAEGEDDEDSVPPDPERLGHDTSFWGIASMLGLGTLGAYCGGESIGSFAGTALKSLGLPTIPTAAALAFFAGVSEYLIVFKAHKRGELGIALSNVFGGMSQVMFMLLPCALLLIGGLGLWKGGYEIPINAATTMLMLLLFPLFYSLHQYLELDRALSNLDAAALTGVYVLLLYFLLTCPA